MRTSNDGRAQRGVRLGSLDDGPRSDSQINEDVSEALAADPRLGAASIHITVSAGEVTLRGLVPDERLKRIAEEAALFVSGTSNVVNELHLPDKSVHR